MVLVISRDGNVIQMETVFHTTINAMVIVMATWSHAEIHVSSQKQRLPLLFNINVRISVLITRYSVMENVLRIQLCVELAVFQTHSGNAMRFATGIASLYTKIARVHLSAPKVHLRVSVWYPTTTMTMGQYARMRLVHFVETKVGINCVTENVSGRISHAPRLLSVLLVELLQKRQHCLLHKKSWERRIGCGNLENY